MNIKGALAGIIAVAGLALVSMNVGNNDAGYRTVIQYPNGSMEVKFAPGYYLYWFGKRTVYPDYLTYDFSAGADGKCEYEKADGVMVRYQDGGEGNVCGMSRVLLPSSQDLMIKMHKAYRDEEGMRSKMMNQVFPKVLNLTAAMLTSEEAYATKRSEFIRFAQDQARRGVYRTKLIEKNIVVGIDENGKEERQVREIPEPIIGKDGQIKTEGSDFDKYGISVEQFDLKAWDFEQKTRAQISKKREAEQAIAIAKSNAKKAYWEEQRVIAEGKQNVAQAEYQALEKAKKEIVDQDKKKQMAEIAAAQKVAVAAAQIEEQQNLKEAAKEEAERIRLLADAEAHAKKVVLEADNALAQKLEALVQIAQVQSDAQARRQVPKTVIYSGGTGQSGMGTSDDVTNVLNTQLLKNLNALDVDVSVAKKR